MDNSYLREEFNRPSFKEYLYKELGSRCCNCGSTEDVEYHHVVPLANGGTNNISNIVPVCFRCHKAIHGARQSWIEMAKRSENFGRPRTITYEDAEPILDAYIRCEIGTQETWERLGFIGSPRLAGKVVYKEYVEKHSITGHRNNIDLIKKKNGGVIPKGCELGYVIIGNGEPEFFGE